MIVDCVGVCETDLSETKPLEKKPSVPFEKLLQAVAFGSTDPDVLSSLAGRLARLDRRIGKPEREALARTSGGLSLAELAGQIVRALDPDEQRQAARSLPCPPVPSRATAQLTRAASALLTAAAAPLATNPALRAQLVQLKQSFEQTIDALSKDELLEVGFSEAAKEAARALVDSFEKFVAENEDEITAPPGPLQPPLPQAHRLRGDPRAGRPHRGRRRARGPRSACGRRTRSSRQTRCGARARRCSPIWSRWCASRSTTTANSSPSPTRWRRASRAGWPSRRAAAAGSRTSSASGSSMIRDHISANLGVAMDDFDFAPFAERGGRGRAVQVFGQGTGEPAR